MKAITASNVISADDYKQMVLEVLGFAGRTVCKTLGPCANASIIEEMGPLVSSKDGFHTLQRIKFDPKDVFANNIMNVILRISHRMVSMVGDGSTSAVVAAWKFAEILLHQPVQQIRPRDIEVAYNQAISMVTKAIEENATHPSAEELPDVMYKTALVSTNFDEEFAQMMKDIYVKTENNAIFSLTKAKRGETKTTYDIISGYKAEHYYMVDKIFHNVPGEFITANCHVICFDMAVDVHHYNMIQELARLAHEGEDPHNPSEIVVVAPSYDQNFLDRVRRDTELDMQMMAAKQIRHFRIRYMRCLSVDAFQRNEYMDFCMLVGSTPITASDFNQMVNIMEGTEKFDEEILRRAIGKAGTLRSHGNEYTVIDGFVARNKPRFDIVMNEVHEAYQKLYQENVNARVPSAGFIYTRRRWNKLQCKMVEIIIGANNEYEMNLKYDAAEDATLACDSVARFGYNIGGNMAIILATEKAMNDEHISGAVRMALKNIQNTFIEVLHEVFANKYTSDGYASLDETTKKIIECRIADCCNNKTYYDLIAGKETKEIINSPRTDIEILNGAMRICLALMTANQYISQFPNIPVE